MQAIQIVVEASPSASAADKIQGELQRYNEQKVGEYTAKKFSLMAYGPAHTCVGGMVGWLQWGWLFIDLAWVDEAFRGQGVGRTLLGKFEAIAKEHGIGRSRLNTASFQGSVEFYKRCGYHVFAELDIDAPNGEKHVNYFLIKYLA